MRKALVAVCHNMPFVFAKTAQSLMEFGWGDRIPNCREKHGFERIFFKWYGGAPRVDMLRNQACHDAIKSEFTHLIFLDADMIWPGPPKSQPTIDMLCRHHDKGIVAGLYVLKGPPYSPAHLLDRQAPESEEYGANMFLRATDYGDELLPVDVVGMGCTIIPVDTLTKMGDRNWFHYDTEKEGWPVVSEDVPFCLKAVEVGTPIFFDPTIKCGHVGVEVYTEKHHLRWQEAQKASAEQTVDVTVAKAG